MSLRVYSQRLYTVNSSAAGATTVYTVPTGYTVIVREITCSSSPGLTGNLRVYVELIPANFVIFSMSAGDSSQHWQGRLVCEEGESLGTIGTAAGFALTISGYVLTN
jgi:hypothetical protein